MRFTKLKTQPKVILNDQIARYQTLNSQRNCYILKSKSKQETKPNWIPKEKHNPKNDAKPKKIDC